MIYRFSDFSLDPEAFELAHGPDKVAVEPQAFSLLQFLIENRDRVVSKDELIETVWDGRIVSDAALNSCVNAARRAVGDDGKVQAIIKTFPRRGFRFVADMLAAATQDHRSDPPQTVSDKTSIAVLTFEHRGADPTQAFYADAIAEDIIAGLSRIRWLFVMSRSSSFSYKGESPDIRVAAQELGVRYVLSGSVTKVGNRIRISCQLVDGQTGAQIWAEHYDRELEDFFQIQDEITSMVVGAVGPELADAESDRVKATQLENLDAWTAFHQGTGHFFTRMNRVEGVPKAIESFQRAIELDPNFSDALAGLAYCHHHLVVLGISKDPKRDLSLGLEAAKKAVSLDVDSGHAHAALGALRYLSGDLNLAIPTLEGAIELNPSQTMAYISLSFALIASGRAEEALQRIDTALHFTKYDPQYGPLMVRKAEAHFLLGDYEHCVEWARKSLLQPETQIWGHCILVAGLGQLGRHDEATRAVEDLLARKADFTCEFARTKHGIQEEEFQLRLLDGLRKAGIPDG